MASGAFIRYRDVQSILTSKSKHFQQTHIIEVALNENSFIQGGDVYVRN